MHEQTRDAPRKRERESRRKREGQERRVERQRGWRLRERESERKGERGVGGQMKWWLRNEIWKEKIQHLELFSSSPSFLVSHSLWAGKVAWDRHGSHPELSPFFSTHFIHLLSSLSCPIFFCFLSFSPFLCSYAGEYPQVCHSYLVSSSHQAPRLQLIKERIFRRWDINPMPAEWHKSVLQTKNKKIILRIKKKTKRWTPQLLALFVTPKRNQFENEISHPCIFE